MITKFSTLGLNKPTPKRMRILGNALMVVGAVVAGSIYATIPWIGVVAFVIGLSGKFLTEFFVDE